MRYSKFKILTLLSRIIFFPSYIYTEKNSNIYRIYIEYISLINSLTRENFANFIILMNFKKINIDQIILFIFRIFFFFFFKYQCDVIRRTKVFAKGLSILNEINYHQKYRENIFTSWSIRLIVTLFLKQYYSSSCWAWRDARICYHCTRIKIHY